ncbi:hypothetical protein [Anaerosporobacter faecicola]|uniref:hypothetical protein n=1 Tax=Anaerosporobacter faecicola TaxID=2718714 RepID=UPI00143BC531|nr:hypothetical protein [Anaerosporobacter faecicola]
MREALLSVGAAMIAGIVVMILHELPKSIIYYVRSCPEWREQPGYQQRIRRTRKEIGKLWKYIDPIGLLLCMTTYSGFSKPYMYRMKDRKTNKIAGISGFATLLFLVVLNLFILRLRYTNVNVDVNQLTSVHEVCTIVIPFYFFYFMAYISMNMLLVNLIPVSTFDIGLLIAGYSPSKYFSIIKNDHYIKMILLFTVLVGVISTISSLVMETLLVII